MEAVTLHLALQNELKPVEIRRSSLGMSLRSQVRGRQRWYVEAIEDRPRLAAAVELVLKSERGVKSANANPLTGQVLIHFQEKLISEPIDVLISRAVEFGPMSRDEFSALPPKPRKAGCLKHFLAMEIGCSAVQMAVLGGFCPLTLGAAGLMLYFHSRS